MTADFDFEAIIVGGGPAGSTLAAALAEAGRRVLLLDKARFPRHKACSDYVNPAGVQILGEVGVLDEAVHLGAHWMDGMIVHAPDGHRFTAHYARAEPGRAALGLSRQPLDQLLLERANAAGVTVCERAHVRGVVTEAGRVRGVTATISGTRESLRALQVVGADGRNSIIRRALGLDAPLRWPRKTGLAAHFRGIDQTGAFGEMHIGLGLYAGLAWLENGLANLTIVVPDDAVRDRAGAVEAFFAGALGQLPELAQSLAGAAQVGGIRGVGSMACRSRRVVGDGYLLVGDAASFLDPFAGEGVYEALRGAHLAAPVVCAALAAGDTSDQALEPYRQARRRAFMSKRAVSWIVQGFINTPPAMNYVTKRLSERDDLGLILSGVLGNFRPASQALSPVFLARLLRP
jgi:2-polyprenyl-6-methoxyphenol hydroxylase-like FAD-dependent oxidoreductase